MNKYFNEELYPQESGSPNAVLKDIEQLINGDGSVLSPVYQDSDHLPTEEEDEKYDEEEDTEE